ncbi:MAG: VCBS repeat-containing protein [Myxococcota bacterium]
MRWWLLLSCSIACHPAEEGKDPSGTDPSGSDPSGSDPTPTGPDTTSEPTTPPETGDTGTTGTTVTPQPLHVEARIGAVKNGLGADTSPDIGWFLDDDGDGALGPGDLPVMVYEHRATDLPGAGLELVRADGSIAFSTGDFMPFASGSLVDVDGDGWTELVAMVHEQPGVQGVFVRAYRRDGTVLWTSPTLPPYNDVYQDDVAPTAGDLDGDGGVDLVFKRWVLDGATGALRALLDIPTTPWWLGLPALADLDGDGAMEILEGNCVWYDLVPQATWCADIGGPGFGEAETFTAAMDVDPAPGLEVLMVNQGDVHVYDKDGADLATWSIGGVYGSRPCIADFDGDGALEIGVATGSFLAVLEADGTQLWTQAVDDLESRGSCSAGDLDGDGAAELLFTDDTGFTIRDGATGALEWSEGTPRPAFFGASAIVDFDGDGYAEIVVPSDRYGGGYNGWVVYGGPDWTGVGPQWALPDFSEARLSSTGTVGLGDGGLLLARPVISVPGSL